MWVTNRNDGTVHYYAGAAALHSGSQTATGTFQLDITTPHPEGIADPLTLISLGQTYGSSISAGTVDEWRFSASAGETIAIDLQQLSGDSLTVSLVDEHGTTLYVDVPGDVDRLDAGLLTLAAGGAYTLVVTTSSTQAVSYSFTIWSVPAPVAAPLSVDAAPTSDRGGH